MVSIHHFPGGVSPLLSEGFLPAGFRGATSISDAAGPPHLSTKNLGNLLALSSFPFVVKRR